MDFLPNARRRLTPLECATVASRPGPFESADPEPGEELGRPSEGKPRDKREAQFQDRVLPKTDADLDPSEVSHE